MFDETIITASPVGQRLEMMSNKDAVSYLMFNNKKIDLVTVIMMLLWITNLQVATTLLYKK